ncbi:hypothetical protein E4U55_007754 [Claviceps digitariae]|nr:hypothetical protein E4U55_007754 [Claviceps digitariae]
MSIMRRPQEAAHKKPPTWGRRQKGRDPGMDGDVRTVPNDRLTAELLPVKWKHAERPMAEEEEEAFTRQNISTMRFSITALFLATTAATTAAAARNAKVNRLPDSFWDRIVKGGQVQAKGQSAGAHKRIEGQLNNYQLRVRKNDPSKLGIDKVKQYSGYLDDEDTDKHLFYWFFESRNNPSEDPVILWLNGGPGCSSFVGLFTELGPATLPNKDLKPVPNPYSWNTKANVIFIDQPVNVGYSYSNNDTTTSHAAAEDIYALLTLFFHEFPEYAKQDFFVTGESYAGHYIPAIGHEILSHKDRNINLKGLAIGNGLTDPLTQYSYYRPMACGEGGYKAVLSPGDCQRMKNAEPECTRMIKKCYDEGNADACIPAQSYCNTNVLGVYQANPYDILHQDGTGKENYASDFLDKEDTKKALGVEVDRSYEECSQIVYDDFTNSGDWMSPAQRVIPDILAQIPVLIYAGDIDYICNWLGNRAWVNALDWPGKSALNSAKISELSVKSGRKYGTVRAAKGLSFMQIYKAGHTVPQYEGEGSLDFINRWIGGEWSK